MLPQSEELHEGCQHSPLRCGLWNQPYAKNPQTERSPLRMGKKALGEKSLGGQKRCFQLVVQKF